MRRCFRRPPPKCSRKHFCNFSRACLCNESLLPDFINTGENMNKPNITYCFSVIAAVLMLGSVSIFGQTTSIPEQSYEATLYVVIGSDDAAQRGDLPKSLDAVSKQIRDNFTFKIYRLMNTYYGRLANNGSLEYKSGSS